MRERGDEILNKREFMESLIDDYKDMVYDLCMRLTNDVYKSEDLFQETWLKVAKSLDKVNNERNIRNYIYTICINSYKNNYGKEKRWLNIIKDYFSNNEKESVINNICFDEDETINDVIRKFDETIIQNEIANLKEIYRIPIILFYYKDFSYEQISEILKIPLGTVKYRLNMAKKLLKEMLEGEMKYV